MSAALSIFFAALTATNAFQIAGRLRTETPETPFDVTGRVTFVSELSNAPVGIEDDSGPAVIFLDSAAPCEKIRPGQTARFRGLINRQGPNRIPTAISTGWEILSSDEPPEPLAASEQLLQDGALNGRLVTLKGTVVDAFRDEIDPLWNYIVLDCADEMITAVCPSSAMDRDLMRLVPDAEVSVTGLCINNAIGARRFMGVTLYMSGGSSMRILRHAPADPFSAPEIPDGAMSPMQVKKLGKRRVRGRVIAVWNADRALLRSVSGALVGLTLRDRTPRYGDAVEAVGYAETDLYRINLSRVVWRETEGLPPLADERAEPVTAADILRDEHGNPTVMTRFQGRVIRLSGKVLSLPGAHDRSPRIRISNGELTVPVDFTSAPEIPGRLAKDCVVEVEGVCILNTENWQAHAAFPHTDGFTLVPRGGGDVVLVKRPPWWTAGRLFGVIGILFAALVAISAWNRILNRLAERRGRELARERSAHERAELKVEERMRLAVELHDTIAQDLTGITLQAEAARFGEKEDAAQTLAKMAHSLSGCRERLRDCIWDLRNRALEEPTFEGAVIRTLAPHLGGTALEIESTVARRRFSDNALHHVLSITRELAINAVRHGKASKITLSAEIRDGRFSLSVHDDGTGFDTTTRPGPSHGHFGLQGVAERAHRLEGNFSIESAPGRGTTARIENIDPEI